MIYALADYGIYKMQEATVQPKKVIIPSVDFRRFWTVRCSDPVSKLAGHTVVLALLMGYSKACYVTL